mgnify:CR=1 FL=1
MTENTITIGLAPLSDEMNINYDSGIDIVKQPNEMSFNTLKKEIINPTLTYCDYTKEPIYHHLFYRLYHEFTVSSWKKKKEKKATKAIYINGRGTDFFFRLEYILLHYLNVTFATLPVHFLG